MNVATGGFGTEVTVKTDPRMKQQLGGAAYILTGVQLSPTLISCSSVLSAVLCQCIATGQQQQKRLHKGIKLTGVLCCVWCKQISRFINDLLQITCIQECAWADASKHPLCMTTLLDSA